MCDKAVDTYPSTTKFFPECYKTQKICHRAVQRCFFVFDSIPDKYKTQEICNVAASLYFPFILYCPYKYITQEMCSEAVEDSLAALKLIPDWFVTSKIIKKLFTALYVGKSILYFNEDSGDAVNNYNEVGIVNIDLHDINLDINFDEDDPATIILIRHIKFENRKAPKKEIKEKLMPVVWHPNRWWNFCVPEHKEKGKEPIIAE